MNRSAVREFHAPGISVPRGELLVPSQVGDPARGQLMCPAGPLIGGSLQRKGWRAAVAPVPQLDDLGSDQGGAAVYLATCAQRSGQTAALAAAASPDDRRAAAAASAAVEEWAAVAGTRRLLMAGQPWCPGALNALATARATVSEQPHRPLHIYGELAAPPQAAAELAGRGVTVTATLEGIPPGDIVIFPAHGVPPALRAEALARGLAVVDATCPLVAHAQDQAARPAERGDDMVLIGHPGQLAAAAITGSAGRAAVVESAGGAATLQVTDARRVSYLLQPGIPVEWSGPVIGALRSRFPALRGPNPDGFCYAASDRAQTVRAIAADCELLLVLGDADSADTRQLSGLTRDGGARPQVIGAVSDLTPAMLTGVSTIGLAESTSAPSALAGQVTAALSGLGPLSVVRRQVASQITEEPPSQPAPI
ncbi:MAG TPA: 4-hydroxy-3-methylbut-2-enyl diphosphate reductase [Streptosporangiaceae bacterium]|nr:4-hydroxy-3-methylbut-2-enyl diphosphate reductase [Streptosporangiaceae bacterium]